MGEAGMCLYLLLKCRQMLGGGSGENHWIKGGRNCWLLQNGRRWVQEKQSWFEDQFLVLNPTTGAVQGLTDQFIHSTNMYILNIYYRLCCSTCRNSVLNKTRSLLSWSLHSSWGRWKINITIYTWDCLKSRSARIQANVIKGKGLWVTTLDGG